MIRTLAFVVSISTALAATATAAPQRESTTFERRAHELVERHFTALAAGDEKALATIWSTTATVTSPTSNGSVRVVPIATAFQAWLAARAGVRGRVQSAKKAGDGVEVNAVVRWNGTLYRDRLVVIADKRGILKIASKFTAPIGRESRQQVGYGGTR